MADDFVFTYPLEGDDKAQFINDVVSGELSTSNKLPTKTPAFASGGIAAHHSAGLDSGGVVL